MRTKLPLLCLLLAILSSAAVAQSFRGELTTRYRDRWGSSDWADEDIYAYLRLSFGQEGWRYDGKEPQGLSGALSVRWDQDLLTRANEIDDGKNDLRVYYAYLDVHKIEHFDLRLGRQFVDEAEGFNLTGIKGIYSVPGKHMRFGLFAGQPVSYYTAIGSDELAGGLTWSLHPGDRALLRGSWIHLEEDAVDSDVVTLAYRQAFTQGSNVYVTARTLDFNIFNEVVGGSWHIDSANLLLTGNYRRQEEINDSSSMYFGDLSTVIGPSRPYQQLTLNVSRPLGDLASVGVGFSRRELLHDGENRGNQEFDRYFADLFLTEQALDGFYASLDFSRWQTDRDSSSTLAGSIGHQFFDERLRLDVGSFYAKYDLQRTFDILDQVPQERYDVRSHYLRAEWRVRKRYRVRIDLDRTTDSTSDTAYYEAELRFGLDLGFLGKGEKR